MLQTQIKIGQQLSLNRGEWDDIIDVPTIERQNKKGETITNYILPLVFNLDAKRVEAGDLLEYDAEESPSRFFNVKIQGGNNKAVYTCVELKKFEQLRKTFFGVTDKKTGNNALQGQFAELIDNSFSDLKNTELYETLNEVYQLREQSERCMYLLAQPKLTDAEKENLSEDEKQFLASVTLRPAERLILVVVQVVWSEKGWIIPVLFSQIEGYQTFLKRKFIGNGSSEATEEPVERLCYATGERSTDVGELDISNRYSLNKMFVTTTINYASGWECEGFHKNYQVAKETQSYLERGSKYLLDNYKTRIAGVDHCIIPQLFSRSEADVETTLLRLSRKSDLLFQYKVYQENALSIEDEETDNPYWITFLGFESDGNFFKTINVIKDVSRTHFDQLIHAFRRLNNDLKLLPGLNWSNIMSAGKEKTPLEFNLFTIYGLIPVRKDKEKKNIALNLFKQILEKRPIERDNIFLHFKELILCHRFERYGSYTNIYPNTVFDFAIRNAVFQYAAFLLILKQFNLLKPMDAPQVPEQEVVPIEQLPDYQQRIEQFFTKMQYREEHKALFYLGRALNVVAYKQYEKGYTTKPVLNKLNYNGMDKAAVLRLRKDLGEKTQQFGLHRMTEYSFRQFTEYFKFEGWDKLIKPAEALFIILSGYSFYSK